MRAEEPPASSRALSAYHKLDSKQIVATPAPSEPDEKIERIDVSPEARSTSFGHKTTLLVGAHQFWVEYGRSTNHPKKLFGPFALTP